MKNEAALVEHLVRLRAEKARIDYAVKSLEAQFKAEAVDADQGYSYYFESEQHTVTVSPVERTTYNYKQLVKDYELEQYLENYAKVSISNRLTVTAKHKEAA